MRVCSSCGERNEDWMDICQRCGSIITNADMDSTVSLNNRYEDSFKDDYGTSYGDDDQKSTKKPIENMDLKLILTILVIILICLSFYAFFM